MWYNQREGTSAVLALYLRQTKGETPMADTDLMSVAAARELLGISKTTMTKLIKRGELPIVGTDPLDRRSRLVRRSDVEAILARSAKKDAA